MTDDYRNWIPQGLKFLREDLRELLRLGEDDPESGEPVGWLEDVTGFDPAAIDAAIDRAAAAVKKGRKPWKKEVEHRDKALQDARQPKNKYWRTYRFRPWGLIQAALQRSFEERYRDPDQMRLYAERAWFWAQGMDPAAYPPGLVFDTRAETAVELANTYRVLERYADADRWLASSNEDLKRGSGDLRLAARRQEVEGKLRIAQRRIPEAVERFNRAHALCLEMNDPHLAGRALVSRGRALYTGGDAAGAVVCLEQGMALLDPARDPRLTTTSTQVLIGCLEACGEYRRASELLMESGLRQAFEGEPLNQLRLRWVEAKILAGLDRLERAEAAYREVREGFQSHGLEYDAALVGIELGIVWLRQGERLRLAPLAKEMIDTFRRLNLATEEARYALAFLEVACIEGVATIGALQRTRDFLERHRADPGLKFNPRYMLLGY